MHKEQCAALLLGAYPLGFNFFHFFKFKSNENTSPVIVYLPVSPIAPPNKIINDLLTKVNVWPNLA